MWTKISAYNKKAGTAVLLSLFLSNVSSKTIASDHITPLIRLNKTIKDSVSQLSNSDSTFNYHDLSLLLPLFSDTNWLLFNQNNLQLSIDETLKMDSANVGLGIRAAFNDFFNGSDFIAGLNVFFDYNLAQRSAHRIGLGAELFFKYLKLRLNSYHRILSVDVPEKNVTYDKAISGFDVGANFSLPFFNPLSIDMRYAHPIYFSEEGATKPDAPTVAIGLRFQPVSAIMLGLTWKHHIEEYQSNTHSINAIIGLTYHFNRSLKEQFLPGNFYFLPNPTVANYEWIERNNRITLQHIPGEKLLTLMEREEEREKKAKKENEKREKACRAQYRWKDDVLGNKINYLKTNWLDPCI